MTIADLGDKRADFDLTFVVIWQETLGIRFFCFATPCRSLSHVGASLD
jgi:hypothetical protein